MPTHGTAPDNAPDTEPEAEPDTAPEAPPFATRWVWGIASVVAVVQVVASLRGWYYFDEAYMLALGRDHLDWGSADQPPVTPLLAAAMDLVAPGSIVALRLPVIAATALAVVLAGLIARELGGDTRAQALTAGAQATALWITLGGHWLTPYSLEPVQWLTILWLLIRWVRIRRDGPLLLMGVAAGVAAMTKFQVFLLAAALLVAVLACGPRDLLRRPALWVGCGIAGLIVLPTVVWQAAHGWPQVQMGAVASSEAELFGGRPGLTMLLIALAGVAGTGLLLLGLWHLLRSDDLRRYRVLAVTFVLLYLLFVLTLGRAYYLGGFYAPVMAAGAVWLQHRRGARRTRWRHAVWPVYGLSVVAALAMVAASWAMASPDPAREAAREVASALDELPPHARSRAVVWGQSYLYAAYLDVQSDEFGLPGAHSGSRAYGYLEPPPPEKDIVVFVGSDPSSLAAHFNRSSRVADVGEDAGVWVLEGLREPWDSLWPRLRTLYVE